LYIEINNHQLLPLIVAATVRLLSIYRLSTILPIGGCQFVCYAIAIYGLMRFDDDDLESKEANFSYSNRKSNNFLDNKSMFIAMSAAHIPNMAGGRSNPAPLMVVRKCIKIR
jgi:hypothetical protein